MATTFMAVMLGMFVFVPEIEDIEDG
jgi:hypothetical protein